MARKYVPNKAHESIVADMRREGFVPDLAVQPDSMAECYDCGEEIRWRQYKDADGNVTREQYRGEWREGGDQPVYRHYPECPSAEA